MESLTREHKKIFQVLFMKITMMFGEEIRSERRRE